MNQEAQEQQMPQIRFYQPEDAQQVALCIQELQDYERTLEADRVEGRLVANRYLAELLTSCQAKSGAIFVAVGDSRADQPEIIGMVSVWLEQEPHTYLSTLVDYAYISDLIVRAPFRGSGVGQALLARAEAHARQLGAPALRINALARNELARRSYRRAGFREYEIALLKPLKP